MSRKKSLVSSPSIPVRAEDVPVTRGMLDHSNRELNYRMGIIHGELLSTIREMGTRIDSQFREMDTKFETKFREMDTKFEAKFREMDTKFEAKFREMDTKFEARFCQMDTKIDRVHAEVARIGVLVEEQNARNQIVLEGLSGLFKRQEKVETEVADMKGFIQDLAKALRRNGTPVPS